MWKLLRNSVLGGLLLLGGLGLALWAVAQQQATELASRLEDFCHLTYTSSSASFGGVLSLRDVRFTAKSGWLSAPLLADELQLRTPGPLWLLRRAITHDTDIPESLGVSLIRTRVPALPELGTAGDIVWINPLNLVPFEGFACGGTAPLGGSDYKAMAIAPLAPDLSADYRYDADARNLIVDLVASSANFAKLELHADFSEFTPLVFSRSAAQAALRASTISVDYTDNGYFGRRNQYCAKRADIAVSTFVDRHVQAVQAQLELHRVVVAEALAGLYRELVQSGGSVHLLSLPNANISLAQYLDYDPERVLRFLNLTARHNDAPPVLFKLFFLNPDAATELSDAEAALIHDPLAEPDSDPEPVVRAQANPAVPGPAAAATPTPTLAAVTTPAATVTTQPNPPPSSSSTPLVRPLAEPPAAVESVRRPSAALPPAIPPATRPVGETVQPSGTVERLPTPVVKAAAPRPEGVPKAASGARPPPNTTAALVWVGAGIERLAPEETTQESDYLVLAYDTLARHLGARVTLITAGGKELDGTVESVDEGGMTLSIQRSSGRAEFYVERERIYEVRVRRHGRG